MQEPDLHANQVWKMQKRISVQREMPIDRLNSIDPIVY